MRENRLTPVSESSHDPSGKLPVERAKSQLERHTRYWPMIISQTTIFNMQAVSSMHIVSVYLFVSSILFTSEQDFDHTRQVSILINTRAHVMFSMLVYVIILQHSLLSQFLFVTRWFL